MTVIFIVAHAPLASALKACVWHVLGCDPHIQAFDVEPDECASDSAPRLAASIFESAQGQGALILTDLPGATPSNIAVAASKLLHSQGVSSHVLGGVNASMLLKAINYRNAALDVVIEKALIGATQAVLRVD
ncbi:PTS sugar transporter subunit IIA [Zwartia panacis]|uniref:PTS sugar transporter subunit IIA n=1 Tax=Zwartia panacis TaxID=2683345 RepID=UPI0025B604A1|nr:PTS mannose transporter subunit IIA [Zwartia panacis]MDN4016750.1 PTS mannose transporter subunit IIA [Zwartia panacis]